MMINLILYINYFLDGMIHFITTKIKRLPENVNMHLPWPEIIEGFDKKILTYKYLSIK